VKQLTWVAIGTSVVSNWSTTLYVMSGRAISSTVTSCIRRQGVVRQVVSTNSQQPNYSSKEPTASHARGLKPGELHQARSDAKPDRRVCLQLPRPQIVEPAPAVMCFLSRDTSLYGCLPAARLCAYSCPVRPDAQLLGQEVEAEEEEHRGQVDTCAHKRQQCLLLRKYCTAIRRVNMDS
jgi:hypothetical protein